MLKKSILLFAIATLLAIPSKAQFMDFSQNNGRVFMGLQLGAAGVHTEYPGFAGGFSFTICGFYADFLISPPRYEDDNHIVDELWKDDKAFTVNIGYQIPILPWLRIAPIIGYCQTNWGYVDASTINLHVDSDGTTTNHHDYDVEERFHYFNYGGGVFVNPVEPLELYAIYTNHAIYGGLSIDLTLMGSFK